MSPSATSLALGIVGVVIAGIGRWWDDPEASLLQQYGVGSVVYSLLLALVVLASISPFNPKIPYRAVLGMVCFTSLPALLYAIPVEKFMTATNATIYNAAALGIVATYRVSLLAWFHAKVVQIRWWQNVLAILFTISFIGAGVFIFGYAPKILETMGGMRYDDPVRNQVAKLGEGLSFFSLLAAPIVVVAYAIVKLANRKPVIPNREVPEDHTP